MQTQKYPVPLNDTKGRKTSVPTFVAEYFLLQGLLSYRPYV